MRIEPKIYESTKSTPEVVDANVVEAEVSSDGFHNAINRFFQKIYAFLKWNFSGNNHSANTDTVSMYDYRYGYEAGQHHIRDDC